MGARVPPRVGCPILPRRSTDCTTSGGPGLQRPQSIKTNPEILTFSVALTMRTGQSERHPQHAVGVIGGGRRNLGSNVPRKREPAPVEKLALGYRQDRSRRSGLLLPELTRGLG